MPSQRARPTLLAFLVCDTVIEDVETGKKSLIGLFDLVVGLHPPAYVPELCVYVCCSGGPEQSPCRMTVRFLGPDEEEIARAEETVEFPHENSVAEIVFRFQGLELTRSGWYRFVCDINGQTVAERLLLVELEGT